MSEPKPIRVPPEIDVQHTEDGKRVHVLNLRVSVDVTELGDNQDLMDFTHHQMAKSILLQAQILEKEWEEKPMQVKQR